MHLAQTLLAGIALLAGLQTPAAAFCGFYAGKADASLFNAASQVVLVRDGLHTVLTMQSDYQGPLTEFALVVPTPTTLQKDQVRVVASQLISRLDAWSSPRLAEYKDEDPCVIVFPEAPGPSYHSSRLAAQAAPGPDRGFAPRDKALGVSVEARYSVGEYDIVSLSATQSDGLESWLRESGYAIPAGASDALRPYIRQGMKFFVAKVNLQEQARSGYRQLRPLQFAFDSEKFMLPMRLGMLNAAPGQTQDLIIYLLTRNGRAESSNYRTVRLPTQMNLPWFVKPHFQDFYKALFAQQAATEQYRTVFTEYFWNMGWCDPCADQPLSPAELRDAGVSWQGGAPDARFGSQAAPRTVWAGANAPVWLTRLHVRYSADSFPEDLMFTQTQDLQNWQSRYVIQQPFGSSLAACSASAAQMDCAQLCRQMLQTSPAAQRAGAGLQPSGLQRQCQQNCAATKQAGLDAATRYYQQELPARIETEKQTLARLTGWDAAHIQALQNSSQPKP